MIMLYYATDTNSTGLQKKINISKGENATQGYEVKQEYRKRKLEWIEARNRCLVRKEKPWSG